MEGSEKSDLRSTWRRRQALNRRHGGRRGGRGRGNAANLAGRGRTSNANTTVPEQRDRYGDDDGDDDEGSSGDDRGAREDYAAWLSMVPKDSQDRLRRARVSLPDVHEYTQFVLEARKVGGLGDADGFDDASLDLEAIGACLRGLPRDALLGTSRAAVEEIVRAVERNKAEIFPTTLAKLGYMMTRISPATMRLGSKMLAKKYVLKAASQGSGN